MLLSDLEDLHTVMLAYCFIDDPCEISGVCAFLLFFERMVYRVYGGRLKSVISFASENELQLSLFCFDLLHILFDEKLPLRRGIRNSNGEDRSRIPAWRMGQSTSGEPLS